MKDYYDLIKLSRSAVLNSEKLALAIRNTFAKRNTPIKSLALVFTENQMQTLEAYWSSFVRKSGVTDAPKTIRNAITEINDALDALNEQ
jgi:hypothetical protein